MILLGNLGRDPDVQTFDNNLKKATLNLATTEAYTSRDGERKEITEWHRVILWRRLAEVAEQYLRTGSQLYLEGRLRTRSWEDNEGKTRYTTEVEATNMLMLGGKRDANTPPSNNGGGKEVAKLEGKEEEDDLPF